MIENKGLISMSSIQTPITPHTPRNDTAITPRIIITIPLHETTLSPQLLNALKSANIPLPAVVENATTLFFPDQKETLILKNLTQLTKDIHVLVEILENEEVVATADDTQDTPYIKIKEHIIQPSNTSQAKQAVPTTPKVQPDQSGTHIDIIPEATGLKVRIPLSMVNMSQALTKILNSNETTAIWKDSTIQFPHTQETITLPQTLNLLKNHLGEETKIATSLTKLPTENLSKLTIKFTKDLPPVLPNTTKESAPSTQEDRIYPSYHPKNSMIQQKTQKGSTLQQPTIQSTLTLPPNQQHEMQEQHTIDNALTKILRQISQNKSQANLPALIKFISATENRALSDATLSPHGQFNAKILSASASEIQASTPLGKIIIPYTPSLPPLKEGDFITLALQKLQLSHDFSLDVSSAHNKHALASTLQQAMLEAITTSSSTAAMPHLPHTNSDHFAMQLLTLFSLVANNKIASILPTALFNQTSPATKERLETLCEKANDTKKDKNGRVWRKMTLPLMTSDTIEEVYIFMPYDNTPSQQEEQEQNNNNTKPQRFIIDSHFSKIGHLQLDTLIMLHEKQIKVILRSQNMLEETMKKEIYALFNRLMKEIKWTGNLEYQVTQHFPITDQTHMIQSKY